MMDIDFTYTAPSPLVLDFDPPVKAASGELSKLSLGEPSVNDVWVAEQKLAGKNGNRTTRLYQKALIAKMCKVPETVLDEMPIGAFNRAARFAQGFIDANVSASDFEDDAERPTCLTINFDPPLAAQGLTYRSITLREPTLGQMAKADSHLGDMAPHRVRQFQESIVVFSSGEPAAFINTLPISVLNRAATFVMGFSNPGRQTSTS